MSTFRTFLGVGCRSLCWPCEIAVNDGGVWPLSPLDALAAAQAHAEHLRLDVNAVVRLVLAEARGRR